MGDFSLGGAGVGGLGGALAGAAAGATLPASWLLPGGGITGAGIGGILGLLGGGAAGGFLAGGGTSGDTGPSEQDIMSAMQRDLNFANNLTQQFITQGKEAIDKEFNQALNIGREEIGEELGGRNLVGLEGTPASASTPGQKRFLDFLSKLQTGRSSALADLRRQGTSFNLQTLPLRLQATQGLRKPEQGNDFLSQLAGVGGQAFGMHQQSQQTKALQDILTATTKKNIPDGGGV